MIFKDFSSYQVLEYTEKGPWKSWKSPWISSSLKGGDPDFYSANLHVDMIKCALHPVLDAYLITYLAYRLFYLYNNCDITFLTVFILTHPVNFPCGRKPEHPEKTHPVRQNVDWLFHMSP
jgi:hypothetical protein